MSDPQSAKPSEQSLTYLTERLLIEDYRSPARFGTLLVRRRAASRTRLSSRSSVEHLFETIALTKSRLAQSTAIVAMAELVKKHDLELSEPEHEKLRAIISKVN